MIWTSACLRHGLWRACHGHCGMVVVFCRNKALSSHCFRFERAAFVLGFHPGLVRGHALTTAAPARRCVRALRVRAATGWGPALHRRAFLHVTFGALFAFLVPVRGEAASAPSAAERSATTPAGTVTASGLRYFDFTEGDGASPGWGDLCVIEYVLYTVPRPRGPPGSGGGNALQLQKVDSSHNQGYLIKHGNGRTIQGIEEAIHTMREHGHRRIIVPPRLAYVHGDLGPIPAETWVRQKLAKKLEQGDLLVFDLMLKKVMRDPKDRGYYKDKVVVKGTSLPPLPIQN